MMNMLPPGNALKNIRILIIDDDEEDFIIIQQYIKKINGDTVISLNWSSDYVQALDAICRNEHDVYFVDFLLGAQTGLDLIREAVSKNCEQPLVLLTGAGNPLVDFEAMKAGASDYLIKSELTTEKLERCIRYAVTRHEVLRALKEKEQKYRDIFEKTKDFIFITDQNGHFSEVNQVGPSLFGYSRQSFSGLSLQDLFVHEQDIATLKDILENAGSLDDIEIEFRAQNFQIVNGILSLSAEKNASGKYYFQGIIHDITAFRKTEQAKLQTARLQATERLVRTLAHEVRNPLNNIILAVEQLEILAPENEKVYLDIVTRNSNRINKLITELLYASKPSVIKMGPASLESVLDNSLAAAKDRMLLKKVALDKQYADQPLFINADAEKLCTAFLNLIINGIEASPEEGAKLTISVKQDRGNYVVSIGDNGHGIGEEDLGRVFEPYFTSKSAGMGLGLASALSIFESHRALVQVKSKAGYGTTFHIIFKVQEPATHDSGLP